MSLSENKAKSLRVAVGVIRRGNQILIAKRPDHLHKGGLWEFPGGKAEPEESVEQALARELNEELGIQPDLVQIQYLFPIEWTYAEKKVRLEICLVEKFSGDPLGVEGQLIKWVGVNELRDYEFPEANLEILNWLEAGC